MHADHVLGIVPIMLGIMGPGGAGGANDTVRLPIELIHTSHTDQRIHPLWWLSQAPRVTVYGPSGIRALIRTTLTLCYSDLYGKYVVHELLWPEQKRSPKSDSTSTEASSSESQPSGSNYQDPAGDLQAAVNPVRTLPDLPPHASELPGKDILLDPETCSWRDFATIPNQGTNITVSAAPILHRCPTLGFVFQEDDTHAPLSQGMLDLLDANGPALREQQGMKNPRQLLGRILKSRESVTLPDGNTIDPPPLDRPGRKIVILGDTYDATGAFESNANKGIVPLAFDCDVLVHESTNAALPPLLLQNTVGPLKIAPAFEEVEQKARDRGHSTPEGAGNFAGLVRAKQLILNHFSVRYDCVPHWLINTKLRSLDYDNPPTKLVFGHRPNNGYGTLATNGSTSGVPAADDPDLSRDGADEEEEVQVQATAVVDVSSSEPVAVVEPIPRPERAKRIIEEIERQATTQEMASYGPYYGHGEGRERHRAIAAYDGFVYDVRNVQDGAAPLPFEANQRQGGGYAPNGSGSNYRGHGRGRGRGGGRGRR